MVASCFYPVPKLFEEWSMLFSLLLPLSLSLLGKNSEDYYIVYVRDYAWVNNTWCGYDLTFTSIWKALSESYWLGIIILCGEFAHT